ncbi:IPT/TIG domain-containing protein [Flagellimonas sp. 389]|uniref:IPT/TIG domain-containing protein n=1 Tax=Flagellimonas sp. 389 TaxID=2835862 RepID=UPI001BD31A38|nr:IPT/TIG domain-containing protein [Flagellimonas sp. 389]MBS9461499.1 IPT/TIG domain-containing protein [Flagellimonas sp. 389]
MKKFPYSFLIILVTGIALYSCGKDDASKTEVVDPEEEKAVPSIRNISPSEGIIGLDVIISGDNLGSDKNDISISFNGIVTTHVVFDESGNVIVTVPQGAKDGDLILTVNGESSEPLYFNILPSITDFNPKEAKEGEQITISGTSFGDDKDVVGIMFGGNIEVDDITINDNGDIVAVVPPGAQKGIITVTIDGESAMSEKVLDIYRIYVAGKISLDGSWIATLWTNGVEEQLSEDPSAAHSVFVYGDDVYVSGYIKINNTEAIATIWKNGEVYMELTDGLLGAVALSVYVANDNVYAAGGEWNNNGYIPKIWKNGEEVFISDINPGIARSVFVDGNDFYVCGEEIADGEENVLYWKNGERYILESFPFDVGKNYTASSIYVKDGIVHVVGAIGNFVANSWAADTDGGNITSTILAEDEELYSSARSVFVDGDDIYIAGRYDKKAVIWKNGIIMEMPSNPNPNVISDAVSVFLYKGDIYVAGGDGTNTSLWVNYSQILLPSVGDASYAGSVFVY